MNNRINSKWDQLPSDIVLEILRKCEKIHNCISINKNWSKMTQYLLYREIKLELKQDDRMLHTLTHSQFNPGRFVFRINIISVDTLTMKKNPQPFKSLITHCPHVSEILFLKPLTSSQWKYFELGITSNPIWNNLTKIFYPFQFNHDSYTSYLKCASILKKSLRHLIIGTRRIHLLEEFFPTIKHLTLNGVMKNMIEFERVVSCFPNLIEAGVDFHVLNTSNKDDVTSNENVLNTSPQHDHQSNLIKRFNILYSIPASDLDLRCILSRFSTLHSLLLEFHKLPQAIINNEGIIQSFFRQLCQIPIYKVSFINNEGNLNHSILVLKAYYAGLLSSKSTHALNIIYNTNTHNHQLPQIILSNKQDVILEINSRGNFDYHVAGQTTQHILTDKSIAHYFDTLRYHFNQEKNATMQLVHILPRLRGLINLKTLVFTGGMIMPISVVMHRPAFAKQIIFNSCEFTLLESFNTFLKHFNQLESVELNQCEFYRQTIGSNEVNINARHIILCHLSLDVAYLRPKATYIYLKVQLMEQGTRYYFLDVENQDENDYLNFSGPIDEAMYYKHLQVLCEPDMLFIHIQAMSLEKLTICWNGYKPIYDFSI